MSLATIGLPSDAVGLMQPMLRVLNGRTQFRWQLAEPNDADVLVVGPESDSAVLARWQTLGKPTVTAKRASDTTNHGSHAIELPLRMFSLLTLLNDLEAMFASKLGIATGSNSIASRKDTGLTRFVSALRALNNTTATGRWRRAGAVYVRDDGLEFALNWDQFEALQTGKIELDEFSETVAHPPGNLVHRPIETLAWYAGWALDGDGLLPELDARASFKLRRWPDFDAIGGNHSQIRLAAMLVSAPLSRDAMVARTGIAIEQVNRFLNAAAVVGVLEAITTVTPAPLREAPVSRFSALLRGVRSKLGLS